MHSIKFYYCFFIFLSTKVVLFSLAFVSQFQEPQRLEKQVHSFDAENRHKDFLLQIENIHDQLRKLHFVYHKSKDFFDHDRKISELFSFKNCGYIDSYSAHIQNAFMRKQCYCGSDLFRRLRQYEYNLEFFVLSVVAMRLEWLVKETQLGKKRIKVPAQIEEKKKNISHCTMKAFLKRYVYSFLKKYLPYHYFEDGDIEWNASDEALILCEVLSQLQFLKDSSACIEKIQETLSLISMYLENMFSEKYLKNLFDKIPKNSVSSCSEQEKDIQKFLSKRDSFFIVKSVPLSLSRIKNYYKSLSPPKHCLKNFLNCLKCWDFCAVSSQYKAVDLTLEGWVLLTKYFNEKMNLPVFFISFEQLPTIENRINQYMKEKNEIAFIVTAQTLESLIEFQEDRLFYRKNGKNRKNKFLEHIYFIIVQKSEKTHQPIFYSFDSIGVAYSDSELWNSQYQWQHLSVPILTSFECHLFSAYTLPLIMKYVKDNHLSLEDLLEDVDIFTVFEDSYSIFKDFNESKEISENIIFLLRKRKNFFSLPPLFSFPISRTNLVKKRFRDQEFNEILIMDKEGDFSFITSKDLMERKNKKIPFCYSFIEKTEKNSFLSKNSCNWKFTHHDPVLEQEGLQFVSTCFAKISQEYDQKNTQSHKFFFNKVSACSA